MGLAALMLIDVQQGFDDPCWGVRNNPQAEENIARLLVHWRASRQAVIHIRHESRDPSSPLRCAPGIAFKPEARPAGGETIFTKHVNSAFIGTGLEQHLRSHDVTQLVIAGLTTDHCVSTTARMAGNLGFEVILVSDATATFNRRGTDGLEIPADDIHRIHLASLNDEFCRVLTTADVLIELAVSLKKDRSASADPAIHQ